MRLALFGECLQVVETADEQQVGDLLDHLDRVVEDARPERDPRRGRPCSSISPVITALLNSPYKPEQDCIYEATPTTAEHGHGARLPGMSVACAMIPHYVR